MNRAEDVDEYIKKAPEEIQERLGQIRRIIISLVPKAKEKISYGMPFYDFKGPLVYFAAQKNYIGLYIPPPIIADFEKELRDYVTTKSAIHLPNDKKLPSSLIRKLVKARAKWNESKV